MNAAPQLRLDRSKRHSTVHGERTPDDPHYGVQFIQDGIPFGADGLAIPEKIADDRARKVYERKLQRLAGQTADVQAQEPDEEQTVETDDGDDDGDDDVNLEAWLRGDAKYPWFTVSSAIRKRFARQVTSVPDAVVFLVKENVLPATLVADRFQAALK